MVARADIPALTGERLIYVAHNYLRPETMAPADARLVNYQPTIGLARARPGGDVASADGMRFVVPARAFHGGPNRHYFGRGSGITLYGSISNQYTQFHHIVIPGTLRDSIFILEGLNETHELAVVVRPDPDHGPNPVSLVQHLNTVGLDGPLVINPHGVLPERWERGRPGTPGWMRVAK